MSKNDFVEKIKRCDKLFAWLIDVALPPSTLRLICQIATGMGSKRLESLALVGSDSEDLGAEIQIVW